MTFISISEYVIYVVGPWSNMLVPGVWWNIVFYLFECNIQRILNRDYPKINLNSYIRKKITHHDDGHISIIFMCWMIHMSQFSIEWSTTRHTHTYTHNTQQQYNTKPPTKIVNHKQENLRTSYRLILDYDY